jgi:hypothetical protein
MAVLGSGKVEIDTYGELKTLIAAVTTKQKGLKIKGVVIDAIVDELVGKLPGGPTAKKTLDFVKAAFGKPDTVKTNTWLDRLDVDDQFSAIVDDTIENNFLQSISKRIESQKDNTPLRQDFNMNTELIDYLKQKYKGRSVAGPQNENKKMKKSQLRQLVKEAMAGGYAMNRKSGKLEPHYDKLDSTKLSSLLMGMLDDEPEKQKYQGDPEEGERILTQKSDPENVARILRGEKPIYKNESVFSSNHITNIRPQGSFNDLVNVDVYKSDEGEYELALSVYTVSGRGMSERHQLKFADRAIPMDQFTAEHVIDRVGTVYNLNDKSKQQLVDFVTKISDNPKIKSA